MAAKKWLVATGVAALFGFSRSGFAEPLGCERALTRSNLVHCVLEASPDILAGRLSVEALRGRQLGARSWLPSNPVLSVTASRRSADGGADEAFNWYASLAQEVEISGARGARKDAANSQVSAQEQLGQVTQRDVAAEAWLSFFEVVAAQEDLELTTALSAVGESIATVARARADQGLSSPLEADVAEASAQHLVQERFAGERRLSAAQGRLAILIGLDPAATPNVQGDLAPISGVEAAARQLFTSGIDAQPEVRAAQAEQRTLQSRADMYRRLRVPNPTVSVFAQKDGFNEQVLGVGLSFPIPLPSPVGQTHAGDIAETEALSRRAAVDTKRVERQIHLTVIIALRAFQSQQRELAAFGEERVLRSEQALQALSRELQAGRLNVRDALASEQVLVQLLQAHVAARHALARASVDLARATGMSLDGGHS